MNNYYQRDMNQCQSPIYMQGMDMETINKMMYAMMPMYNMYPMMTMHNMCPMIPMYNTYPMMMPMYNMYPMMTMQDMYTVKSMGDTSPKPPMHSILPTNKKIMSSTTDDTISSTPLTPVKTSELFD